MTKTELTERPENLTENHQPSRAERRAELSRRRKRDRQRMMPDLSYPDQRITASEVQAVCGGITSMTLWRWLQDAELAFPNPIVINRIRYWRLGDIMDWLESQS